MARPDASAAHFVANIIGLTEESLTMADGQARVTDMACAFAVELIKAIQIMLDASARGEAMEDLDVTHSALKAGLERLSEFKKQSAAVRARLGATRRTVVAARAGYAAAVSRPGGRL